MVHVSYGLCRSTKRNLDSLVEMFEVKLNFTIFVGEKDFAIGSDFLVMTAP